MITNNLLLPLPLPLLVLLLPTVLSFNLETRAPVVKLGGDYVNSFFGFSVAQHRTGAGEPVLLIGAPQDRNLQPGTERSGALYRCPLSSDTTDCSQVVTDGKRHNSGPYKGIYDGGIAGLQTPVKAEIKDGQWLGVAVSSQGRTELVVFVLVVYSLLYRDSDGQNANIDTQQWVYKWFMCPTL